MTTLTKKEFLALLDAAGLTPEQRDRFHTAFEQRHPEAHEAFLRWLQVPPADIAQVRQHAKGQ